MIYSDSRSVVRRLLPKERLLFPKIPGNFLFLSDTWTYQLSRDLLVLFMKKKIRYFRLQDTGYTYSPCTLAATRMPSPSVDPVGALHCDLCMCSDA